jgi:excinuclease ABC subunit B
MNRRRKKQLEYNVIHHIKPKSIIKAVSELDEFQNISLKEGMNMVACSDKEYKVTPQNIDALIADLKKQMEEAAEVLDFETAAILRDKMNEMKSMKSSKYTPPKNKSKRARA